MIEQALLKSCKRELAALACYHANREQIEADMALKAPADMRNSVEFLSAWG